MVAKPKSQRRSQLSLAIVAGVTSITLALLAPTLSAAAPSATAAAARAARVLNISETAHMHEVPGSPGGTGLIEEGRGFGTLSCTVRVSLIVGTTVTGSSRISLSGGTLSGHASARLHYSGGVYASFGGTLTITRGTGRYAHAGGTDRLYGTINRSNHRITVQVIGQLRY